MLNFVSLVSVIIPIKVFDAFFEKALNSILDQTYPHLEIVMIYDNPNIQEKIEDWMIVNKSKIKKTYQFVHLLQEISTLPVIINKGISISSGEFITILSSDDIYHSRRIEKLIEFINLERSEMAFTTIQAIDKELSPLPFGHTWRNVYERQLAGLGNAPTIGFQLLEGNLAVTVGNLLFSKKLWSRLEGFKDFEFAYVYDFILRALLLIEPAFLDEELLTYRIQDDIDVKLKKLSDQEIHEIYQNYLVTSSFPPENTKAPCHCYWPLTFSLTRSKLNMDKGLSIHLTKSCKEQEKVPSTEKKFPWKSLNVRSTKQTICLITHNLTLTGAPKLVIDMAQSLKQRGYKVKVISLYDGPLKKELQTHQIPLYVLPKGISKNLSGRGNFLTKCFYFLVTSLLLQLKMSKITIFNTVCLGRLLIPISFVNPFHRIIWYIHDSFPLSISLGMWELEKKDWGMTWLRKLVSRLIKYRLRKPNFEVWFGSQSTNEILKKSNLNGKTIYWSGIPRSSSSQHVSNKVMTEILAVGTSMPRKGTHDLIEAFITGVKEKLISDDVRLTIIGFEEKDVNAPHHYVGDLILKVIHSGLKERIRLIANVQPEQLEDYYHQADLYVHSSIVECLPLALLKAMSIGLPIVTTNANGCIEAIEHHKTGYVCSSRNSRLLLETMTLALNNPEKSRKLGIEAKKVFDEKFSLETNINDILLNLK